MIVKISEKPENHEIQMDYEVIDNKPKVFIDENNNILGYIWFNINEKVMNIKMIEMIEKEEGNGTEAIKFLIKTYPNINQITGQVLGENGMRAYWFWESLGSEMSVPMDEIENNIVRDCYFVLNCNN